MDKWYVIVFFFGMHGTEWHQGSRIYVLRLLLKFYSEVTKFREFPFIEFTWCRKIEIIPETSHRK